MPVSTFILPNGLQIIHSSSPTDVAYCGIAVNAGTRDELPDENGLAHFCEHLTFKGTHRRRAWHILNRMETVGGDLNAYTGKEETVYYTTFLKEHLFADIFARGVLSYAQRETATVAALAALGNVAPQLQAHMGMAMNVGVSAKQIEGILAVIKQTVGRKTALQGLQSLRQAAAREEK